MSLRTLRVRPSITTSSINLLTRRAPQPRSFLSTSTTTHNGPTRASLRPITLLLLCIPLGYGIRYTLKHTSTSGDDFITYTLTAKHPISSTTSIFTLQPAQDEKKKNQKLDFSNLPQGAIASIEVKQPQLQIARAYTPLPSLSLSLAPGSAGAGTEEKDTDAIRLLIRRETRGEVSGYLHRLPVGSDVQVRGPQVEAVVPRDVGRVVFLAGGTGIAPAVRVVEGVVCTAKEGEGQGEVSVLWACRRREDCRGGVSDSSLGGSGSGWWGWPWWGGGVRIKEEKVEGSEEKGVLVAHFDALKETYRDRLRVEYFVDEESSFIRPGDVKALLLRREGSILENEETKEKKNIIFVSGPDGFVSYWAGAKEWVDGREEQGRLGGVLATMDVRGWEVVKL